MADKLFVVTFSERMLKYKSLQRISKFEYKIRHFAIMKKKQTWKAKAARRSFCQLARACYSSLSNLFFFKSVEAEVLAIYLID